MNFSQFIIILKQSNLIKEINKCVIDYNKKLETLDYAQLMNIRCPLLKGLSTQAKKELIAFTKKELILPKLTVFYGIDKPENISYFLQIDINQTTDSKKLVRDYLEIEIPSELFIELLDIMFKHKLNFILTSRNMNNIPQILEETEYLKIFEEYLDPEEFISYDDFLNKLKGDENEEENDSI